MVWWAHDMDMSCALKGQAACGSGNHHNKCTFVNTGTVCLKVAVALFQLLQRFRPNQMVGIRSLRLS